MKLNTYVLLFLTVFSALLSSTSFASGRKKKSKTFATETLTISSGLLWSKIPVTDMLSENETPPGYMRMFRNNTLRLSIDNILFEIDIKTRKVSIIHHGNTKHYVETLTSENLNTLLQMFKTQPKKTEPTPSDIERIKACFCQDLKLNNLIKGYISLALGWPDDYSSMLYRDNMYYVNTQAVFKFGEVFIVNDQKRIYICKLSRELTKDLIRQAQQQIRDTDAETKKSNCIIM